MILEGTLCRIRPYTLGDASVLALLANDEPVSRWMTQSFPYPYASQDARNWLAFVTQSEPQCNFAIEVGGDLAGGIGFAALSGERYGSATFGYWLGRQFWGRGVASEAARMLADRLLGASAFRRVEATVFAPNVASGRVLEKAGFVREATIARCYVDRSGRVCDGLLYGRVQ